MLFRSNGQDFFKFDGQNVYNYGLPAGASGWGATYAVGGSITVVGVTSIVIAAYGYLNERGFYGPTSSGITLTFTGVTFNSILYTGLSTITGTGSGFGITAIVLYRSQNNGVSQSRYPHNPPLAIPIMLCAGCHPENL